MMFEYPFKFSLALLLLANSSILHIDAQSAISNHTGHTGCKPGGHTNTTTDTELHKDAIVHKASVRGRKVECVDGMANEYPCSNIILESFVSGDELNDGETTELNDIWGWTSSDGREFALVGLFDGTSFVEITDANNPVVLGKLPTHTGSTFWRDIKTYQDHAFIVSESGSHGMQVFDLTQLLTASQTSYTEFKETAHYSEFGRSHNIFINEDSGFAYSVGSNTCSAGLHMIDVRSPTRPTSAGCYSDRGYVHDVQCIIYDGPDNNFSGKEICFASNEDKFDIIDVSSKSSPILISTFRYSGSRYVHQGWLTEDRKYFLIDDENDEFSGTTKNTKTFICDVTDLTNPTLKGTYSHNIRAIDHNQYVKDGLSYQANYRGGLRVLDLSNIENGILFEAGYFDTYPMNDNNSFNGAWSNYPYFESGNIIISDIEQGLFVVSTTIPKNNLPPSAVPSSVPTSAPSLYTSAAPTNPPVTVLSSPTFTPTSAPTSSPTFHPSAKPTNVPDGSPLEVFVMNLEASIPSVCFNAYDASLTITVSDQDGTQMNGVSIRVTDQNGNRGRSCTTGSSGRCTLLFEGLQEGVTLKVANLSLIGYTYNPSKNTDIDGDTNGTSVTIRFDRTGITTQFLRGVISRINKTKK